MSLFGLPDLLHQVGIDVGDLEYIEGKVTTGNYFQVSGNINALNNTIEFVVPSGKTAFLIEAKITMSTNPTVVTSLTTSVSTNNQVVADLLVDGTAKSKAKIGVSSRVAISAGDDAGGGAGFGTQADGKFNVLGLSLVGNGAKKIEIKNVLDNGEAFAEMSGYLV